MAWRYIAQRLNGDGTGKFLDYDLPLNDVAVTETLSSPTRITGKVAAEYPRMMTPSGPLLQEWSTAIYVEADDEIRAGGILAVGDYEGSSVSLDCMGFSGYLAGQPYLDSWYGVGVDPMDVAKRLWDYQQAFTRGNLGLSINSSGSPLRVGKELEQIEFDTQEGPVSFEAGPYKLAWWLTDDMGKEFNDLAAKTPFDYREVHSWDGDSIAHRLDLVYPKISKRHIENRFVIGDNISVIPRFTRDADEYANGVALVGAGEGRDSIYGFANENDGRLRKIVSIADKAIRSKGEANSMAARETYYRASMGRFTEIIVRDHPNAPIGSWEVGDEIWIEGDAGWYEFSQWVRVISMTTRPENPSMVTLSVMNPTEVAPTKLKVVNQ